MVSLKWLAPAISFLVSVAVYGSAQNQSEVAIKSTTAQGLPLIKRDWLLNGLQIMMIEQPGSGKLRVHLRVNSGALFDLAGKGGLADLTGGMLLKGGGALTAGNVGDTVQHLGLKLNLTVSWDSTDLIIEGSPDSLATTIDLLGKLVINPIFDQKELDAVKASRISELKAGPPDEMNLVRERALAAVFGTHPFGRPERGSVDSVSQISRSDLLYYHSRFYIANNAELMVAGDVTAEQVTRLARAKLGVWKKGEKVPATFRPPEPQASKTILVLDRPGTPTAKSALAQMGISRRTGDYYAALVMSEVLAASLKKAASSVGSDVSIRFRLEPRYISGPLIFEVVSSTGNAAIALEAILSAMNRLRGGQIPLDEIERAKQQIVAQFENRMSTTDGFAEASLDIELYGLGRDYLIHFAEWIGAVTPGEVQQASNKYLSPNAFSVVVSAPAAEVQTPLGKLGNVAVLKVSAQAR